MKRKNINLIILGFFVLSLLTPVLAADNEVTLHFFYGKGCPHCGSGLDFLSSIKENYPSLVVEEHEVYFNQEERELFEKMTEAFEEKIEGVPTTFVDNKILVGFSNTIANSIEEEIKRCLEIGCEDPINKIKDDETIKLTGDSSPSVDPEKTETIKKLTIPAVLFAALVDAINPCAFAVLIILMSTILGSKNRKKALFSGLAFSLSIFISYFLMGIGLYSAIQATGLGHTFYTVVAILAILIGLFNLKDYLWYGKWFVMEVPMSWRPKLQSLIKSVTSIPGAFAIGFVVSLFLLPCTSGPYIVILGLLAKATARSYAIFLLVIYNLIFILPMILITFAIFFGLTTTEKAERMRKKKLKILHLIAGIIILCLGVGMLIAMKLGMI
ncbi:cytochrome c biogenesis protein [Candidatus Pacearchaeota archaeon]|nr:cytochrome c biogenesis protein [Candidatus Pacearchaeota archaeon]